MHKNGEECSDLAHFFSYQNHNYVTCDVWWSPVVARSCNLYEFGKVLVAKGTLCGFFQRGETCVTPEKLLMQEA